MARPLTGIIPPLVTPFTADGDIDEKLLRGQARFMLAKGVHGVCMGGSTGEGHTLTRDELKRTVEITLEEIGDKIPVVAGIIVNSTRQALLSAKDMQSLGGVSGLQITPVHYLFKPDDEATMAHFRAITSATDIPVIIYNVIPWNYLRPELLVRLMTELPGIAGVKQSQGDMKLMADLLLATPKGKVILSAVDALLYSSFALGAHGTIAANPAAIPGVTVALWDAVQRGDHALGLEMHAAMLRFWNTIVGDNLPACVKYALTQQGAAAGVSRAPMAMPSAAQRAAIDRELKAVLAYDRSGSVAHAA
ncbi:MAG: dihydrodipicolinate synthase family protein [Alphaproteobacteria bacterium]|nr:dihydrodipicolinate synthase family protein [Alphaproteobacteria bacterium]MCW5740210.1 dihydrodipicolinate synthase family protein [Alphaproteobacteria bacterium]